jgi:hypothetical protein
MTGTWLNVGCGPHRAPDPWVNLDVHVGHGIQPDVQVEDPMYPLARYADGAVGRVYMGHVLEHVEWRMLPAFLEDITRALQPGGELMVVGPDVFRVVEQWRDGQVGWELVESALETPWPYASPEVDGETWALEGAWSEARHHWNCYEERVAWALRQVKGLTDVTPVPITPMGPLAVWPLVAYTQWQCAVRAVRADG